METESKDHLKYVGKVNEFLTKTYDMIGYCDERFPDIASWNEDGSQIIVKDAKRLASEIIPKYFDHSNHTSFFRQLNFYNFEKINTSRLEGLGYDSDVSKLFIYQHIHFKRNRADLLQRIKRKTDGNKKCALHRELQEVKEGMKNIHEELESMDETIQRRLETFNERMDQAVNRLEIAFKKKRQPPPNPLSERKKTRISNEFRCEETTTSLDFRMQLNAPYPQPISRQCSDPSFLNSLQPSSAMCSRETSVDSSMLCQLFLDDPVELNISQSNEENLSDFECPSEPSHENNLNRNCSCSSAAWLDTFVDEWQKDKDRTYKDKKN